MAKKEEALKLSTAEALLLTGRSMRAVRALYLNPGCKRMEICKTQGLQPSVLSPIIQAMEMFDLIASERAPIAGRGRPSFLNWLAGDLYTTVGLELSTQRIGGVVLQADQKILAEIFEEPDEEPSPNTSIKRLAKILKKLIRKAKVEPDAVGVAISGVVGPDGQTSREFPSVDGWEDVNVAELLAKAAKIDVPIGVINNVRAAALAELRTGETKYKDFLYIHAGQGLGMGIVVNGEVYNGATNMAGEFGHMSVKEDGPICYCGSRGCLESYASPTAIEAQCLEAMGKTVKTSIQRDELGQVHFLDILKAAEEGDRLASNLIEKATGHLATAAANTTNVLNPEALILGGVFGKAPERWIKDFSSALQSRLVPFIRGTVKVETASRGENACSVGAAVMMADKKFLDVDELRALLAAKINARKEAKKGKK